MRNYIWGIPYLMGPYLASTTEAKDATCFSGSLAAKECVRNADLFQSCIELKVDDSDLILVMDCMSDNSYIHSFPIMWYHFWCYFCPRSPSTDSPNLQVSL